MSAMPMPNIEQFHDFVIQVFGKREGKTQKPTAALGFVKGQCGLYGVVQKASIKDDQYKRISDRWRANGWTLEIPYGIRDEDFDADDEESYDMLLYAEAGSLTTTKAKKSERTGYHAEMMLISSIIYVSQWTKKISTLDDLKAHIKDAHGVMIAANAAACKHCAGFMAAAGIEFPKSDAPATNTGWWNPLTDEVYAHDSSEFAKQVPGF
jgi:hypothetical protein